MPRGIPNKTTRKTKPKSKATAARRTKPTARRKAK